VFGGLRPRVLADGWVLWQLHGHGRGLVRSGDQGLRRIRASLQRHIHHRSLWRVCSHDRHELRCNRSRIQTRKGKPMSIYRLLVLHPYYRPTARTMGAGSISTGFSHWVTPTVQECVYIIWAYWHILIPWMSQDWNFAASPTLNTRMLGRGVHHPYKPMNVMMHNAYFPLFPQIYKKNPLFSQNLYTSPYFR